MVGDPGTVGSMVPPSDSHRGPGGQVPPGEVPPAPVPPAPVPPAPVPPADLSSLLPPADAEEWTDEQWLAWLRATDDPADADPPPPVWRSAQRLAASRGGQVLGSAMLGLAQALYGRRRAEVVVEREAPSDPPGDDDLEVHLDPEHPERSTAIVRRRPRS